MTGKACKGGGNSKIREVENRFEEEETDNAIINKEVGKNFSSGVLKRKEKLSICDNVNKVIMNKFFVFRLNENDLPL